MNKAVDYAKWCTDIKNKKVPLYVKKQAEQWLDIYDNKIKGVWFDKKSFSKICKILKLMIHPDLQCSMYEGLEPYAWFFITAIMCTKSTGDNSRYYDTGVLEIARKNFKTFVSAVIFILLILTEPKFSRFFSVAPDLSLSSELKNAIRKIIKSSPALLSSFKVLRSQIICKLNDSEYTPLAYSKDNLDGKLANAFLGDECGALDEYPIEAMRSSQITLKNKLGIIISTQYPNDNNVMIDEIDISKKTLDGLLKNQRRFSLLYEPDQELQQGEIWQTDNNVIYQANPVAVTNKQIFNAIIEKRNLAILYENKRENFLCKHLNIRYSSLGVEAFIDINKVRQCKIVQNKEFWIGKKVYIGLDLSMTDDNTAVAMVTFGDDEETVYAKVFGFLPKGRILFKTKKEHVDYERYIKQKFCYACGDEVIDYLYIKDFILNLQEEYQVEIVQVGYDKWNALATIQSLEQEGIECVEIKQHSSVLHMPTKRLYELILSKQIHYEDNELLEINFQNAKCTEDTNRNKYVNKKRSKNKVDMVVALINALYLLQQFAMYGREDFVVQF